MTTNNTAATFPDVANISWTSLTAANTAKDGTGTVGTLFSASATKSSWVRTIKCRPLGTNVASVARFFLNNGSDNSTAANNSLIYELSLPAITLTEVAAQDDLEYAIDQVIPAGYKILVTIGTAVAAGWQFTAIGRDL